MALGHDDLTVIFSYVHGITDMIIENHLLGMNLTLELRD